MRYVFKFGGSSLSNVSNIARVSSIVEKYRKDQLVVVCSAVAGVTEQLIDISVSAEKGNERAVEDNLAKLHSIHVDLLNAIGDKGIRKRAEEYVDEVLSQLDRIARGATTLREVTPKSRDMILSCGERLATPIVWGALMSLGVDAVYLTGGDCGIITDDNFNDASPLMELSRHLIRQKLEPILVSGKIPVVTGYIGITQNGEITTLGRGGSDLTATLIGSALQVDEVWIWSDVDGLMTADPSLVRDAKVLSNVTYSEAAEMAVFGAKALHPRTLEPVEEGNIPVRFKNTFNPAHPGTLVSSIASSGDGRVKSVALVKDVAIITVRGASMVGKPGIAARLLASIARSGANIMMISQSVSESNISVVVRSKFARRAANAIELEFLGKGGVKEVTCEDDVSVVAVIGEKMRGTPGIAARIFQAVASKGINVKMIAQGSSELNISFVVRKDDGPEAVRAIHSAFELNKL